MKFKLNLNERITLMEVLPLEGNFITLKVIRELKLNLGVKDEEFKKFDIQQKDKRITWNNKGNEEFEFEFGEKATDIIIEQLEELNKSKKLEDRHFSLFEKFIKNEIQK